MARTEDRNLYEHLSQIIIEYERGALRTRNRQAVLSSSGSSTSSLDYALEGTQEMLQGLADEYPRPRPEAEAVDPPTKEETFAALGSGGDAVTAEETSWSDSLPDATIGTESTINVNQEIAELLGLDEATVMYQGEEVPLLNYLEDCFNCDLRLQYQWQIRPIDLMAPIAQMVDEIEGMVNLLHGHVDSTAIFLEICHALNTLRSICTTDILSMLMSFNMLLTKYLTLSIQIKLDWTVLLAPILQFVIEFVSGAMSSAAAVIMAPLECTFGALSTVRAIERESRELIQNVRAFGDQALDLGRFNDPDNGFDPDFDFNSKFIGITPGESASDVTYPDTPDFPRVNVRRDDTFTDEGTLTPLAEGEAISGPSGFDLNLTRDLEDALRDPDFINTSWLTKTLAALRESIGFIDELETKLRSSLASLRELTTGGLSIEIRNLGIILFVLDMISLFRVIIRLRTLNVDVDDWCSFVEENPSILADALRTEVTMTDVEVMDQAVVIRRGPEIIGRVSTCKDQQDSRTQGLLADWIREINGGKK